MAPTCERARYRVPEQPCTHGGDVCPSCQRAWSDEENGQVLAGPRTARPAGPPPVTDAELACEWSVFLGAGQLDTRSFPSAAAAEEAYRSTWAETYQKVVGVDGPAPRLAYRYTTRWEELPTGTLPGPGNWRSPHPEEVVHRSGAVLHARWRHLGEVAGGVHVLGSDEGCESAQHAASVRATWETSHGAKVTRLERRLVTAWQHD